MKNVVKLFTHLVDKDLFIEVYRNYLAKRLLNDKSESRDQEKLMISFIKMSCGPQFTKKLEGMLSDLNSATEESKQFSEHLHKHPQPFDFNVTVLTSSHWPTYKTFEITIPREIESAINTF